MPLRGAIAGTALQRTLRSRWRGALGCPAPTERRAHSVDTIRFSQSLDAARQVPLCRRILKAAGGELANSQHMFHESKERLDDRIAMAQYRTDMLTCVTVVLRANGRTVPRYGKP
jgi:hypothetical protein